MKFKVVLPQGVEKKTLFVGEASITIKEGQIVTNDFVQKHYPQFFEDMEGKKEVLVETKPVVEVKVEEPMELLIEQPERVVEVEIIADETVAPEEVIVETTPTVEEPTEVVTEAPKKPTKKTNKKD